MFCYESEFENYVPRRAAPDGCNIDDPATLKNLIGVSKFYEPNPRYLDVIQRNSFSIEMRKQLTEWMFEVRGVFFYPHVIILISLLNDQMLNLHMYNLPFPYILSSFLE